MVMMTQTKPNEAVQRDVLVISRTDEGFQVYSPANPTLSYLVSGSPSAPLCSCSEFQSQEYRQGEPAWHCPHITAVLTQFGRPGQHSAADSYDEVEERLAIQQEGQRNGRPSQMLLKRSVSPDGRIDSLSVEFSHSLDHDSVGVIKDKALNTLRLQSDIVGAFLNGSKKAVPPSNKPPEQDLNGMIPATMLNIASMPSRWGGRRLFINVQANGQTLKLFGNKQQLSEFITAAGFWNMAGQVAEGIRLNLPCCITTKPSADGRFQNIDQILPAQSATPQRRAGP